MKNKKGQIVGEITGLAIGILVLAVIAIIGMTVVLNVGSSQASCGTGLNGEATTYSTTDGYCTNVSGDHFGQGKQAARDAFYGAGLMGSGSGGLLTWLPVIIPALIGIAIISYFLALRTRPEEGEGY